MPARQAFLPDDKPRSWVVGVCGGLIGLGIGVLGFAFGMAGLGTLSAAFGWLFVACWCVTAASMLVFIIRRTAGHYLDIEPRPWNEQIW